MSNLPLAGLLLVSGLGLFVSAPASAQAGPAEPTSPRDRAERALQAFSESTGARWISNYDEEIGRAKFVFGGRLAAPFVPGTDADWFFVARAYAERGFDLLGIESATLAPDRVHLLPLGFAQTTDKVTVRFRQVVGGVPVVHGAVHVLMTTEGDLLALDSTGLPALAGLDTAPALPAELASERAVLSFQADTGLPASHVGPAELVVQQVRSAGGRAGVLAWQVDVRWISAGFEPEGFTYWIDAHTGEVAARERNVHAFDVSGQVISFVTPGVKPDTAANPAASEPLQNLRVTSSQGSTTTDANGNFTIAGASAPLTVTLTYDGPFTSTENEAGPDYSLSVPLASSSGSVIVMNPSPTGPSTAQANSFKWVNAMREWVRAIDPGDATADFLCFSNVNIDATCNAVFNGFSINFFKSGAGCANSAFSTIVAHEEGHWLNQRYGSGNGSDGFGEGAADVWAMYLSNSPIVGEDFHGPGSPIRSGLNQLPFCGDCCNGCYGEVHADGQVLMGAMWKIRARAQAFYGQVSGGAVADALMLAWFNAFDDSQIKTVVRDHWLALDDNDGNVGNGTPNYAYIEGGFTDQKFPPLGIQFVQVANVTKLGDITSDALARTVQADLTPLFNAPITRANIRYRVDDGPFQEAPMSPAGGSTWQGEIPALASPARVEYFVEGFDGLNIPGNGPLAAPQELYAYRVGVLKLYLQDAFESASGWTHGADVGQDDWQRSASEGLVGTAAKSGDPAAAWSGSNVWGTDLGAGAQNGAYANDSQSWLRSPAINLSGAPTARLRFRRWLRVDKGLQDQASVIAGGLPVWSNGLGSAVLDGAWNLVDIPIWWAVNGDPSTQIEFRLETDGSGQQGGWNVDDVEVYELLPTGADCTTTNYCTPKPTSAGTLPLVFATGTASATIDDFGLAVVEALPFKSHIYFHGTNAAAIPFLGGTLCVEPPLARGPISPSDSIGIAVWSVPIDPEWVGEARFFQVWGRDPQNSFGSSLSNAVRVDVCE